MRLSGQPALKVRLAASSKRDGNKWAWVMTLFQQPRLCGLSARARSRVTLRKTLVQFSELVSSATSLGSPALRHLAALPGHFLD